MKKDHLLIYASNHRVSYYFQLAALILFIGLKFWWYDAERLQSLDNWLIDAALAAVSIYMLILQHGIYRKILATGERIKNAEVQKYIITLAMYKVAFFVPWMALLFQPAVLMPDATNYISAWPHLLGYIFIFSAIAAFSSASAPLLPLVIFDIGLPLMAGMVVVSLNRHMEASSYMPAALGIFAAYGFLISYTIRKSTTRLIDAKVELQKAARRADDANKAKSSFLALMSHEIRTPMTGIFGMIDFLKETALSAEQRSFIVTISECSKTLLNTLNDILDFSKIESGKLAISKINFDFHAALQNSARILGQIAADKGLGLKLDIAPDVPRDVYGDPHRIQQITMNLLNNAVKFTMQGTVTLRVRFVPSDEARLRVEVIDTGIGISKENIGRLFSAFSQADNSISRKFGGSGLGLSIARNLVQMMGGKIDVISEEGKGSTFWFEIPYEPPQAEPAKLGVEVAEEAPPMNILVAEDNLINARIIQRLLAHKGHHVTVVHNGEEAVKAVQVHPYDLIFMDVNMPVMNGIDATKNIRMLGDNYKKISIIGLTANILEEYVRKCYDAGMVAHIGKPFVPEDIYVPLAKIAAERAAAGNAASAPEAKKKSSAPAATEGGYTVVSQKKGHGSVRTMEEVLTALRDELGLEYVQQTVENDSDEVNVLLDKLLGAHQSQDFDTLGKCAHDIKSVSGLIGMQATSALAAKMQDDCLNKQLEGMDGAVTELQALVAREMGEVRALAKSLPEV